ncbi:hypothetical protein NMH_0150 [Neisseria meningitidis H44/76]|uniref:PilS cassette n=2 Tax=Neisseria meningitidis serogroup B TaxID=491 RepID=A0A0H5DLX9_NEIMI|nr:hypothetical protein NMH_0150 [Neisseria meningitidis H44/76]CRL92485.1 PilS cassette [Neisseria meningitidis serogroup B]
MLIHYNSNPVAVIPAKAGMTKLSAQKPAPRHSHESGNPERKI